MILSSLLNIPFEDRGGLMGFQILPWVEGDNEWLEIFEITQDKKWTPRRFQTSLDNSPPQGGHDFD